MKQVIILLIILNLVMTGCGRQQADRVGIFRTFERSIPNTRCYNNKFTDVDLTCTYVSPSGKTIAFYGFYDGDGFGGGDSVNGTIWKIRFLPDEIGQWSYTWKWSDGTRGGKGTFLCDSVDAGKGILKPYAGNPHWLAYNGTEPVWLKSYYESGHGSIAQPFDWVSKNVYQRILDRGYNHLQVNWLLSLCCFEQIYNDGPAPVTDDLLLYREGNIRGSMRFEVWKMMEQQVEWLNQRNIGLHMFLGFDGSKNHSLRWDRLSESEKDFFVRYVVARLAPYANIAGWNFVWEVPGDRESHELGWARLVKKYDVFGHLLAYQDEFPVNNEFYREEYNLAGVENHGLFSDDRNLDRSHWREAWTHHQACLAGAVSGKPVYMIEGNALWRRYWGRRSGATPDDLRQAAWACATAGASFNWCGHLGEDSLMAYGPEGLPFDNPENEYAASADQIDLLARVMTRELQFWTMNPADSLLLNHDPRSVWCLAEPGVQYLVFSKEGCRFNLSLESGSYPNSCWINTLSGDVLKMTETLVADDKTSLFVPPKAGIDWILLVRN